MFLCLIILSIFSLLSCKSENDVIEEAKEYTFKYDFFADDAEYKMYYTDDYFKDDSSMYNKSLATSSLCLTMATDTYAKNGYEKSYEHAYDLINNLGFTDIEVNESYKKKPDLSTFAIIMGRKKYKGYNLICISPRGLNYGDEVYMNVKISGDNMDYYHQSYYDYSEMMFDFLSEYINKYNISGKLKIWTTGYSKSASVANIFTGRLDEKIKDNEYALKSDLSLKKEDIYTYTFEAPAGVIKSKIDVKTADYNNIFNIINYNDLITRFVMIEFGYSRYGIDIVLPNNITDPNYEEDIKLIIDKYNNLTAIKHIGEYNVDSFDVTKAALDSIKMNGEYHNYILGLYLDELFYESSAYGLKLDKTEFIEECEKYVMDLAKSMIKIDNYVSELLNFFQEKVLTNQNKIKIGVDILLSPDRLENDMRNIIEDKVDELDLDIDKSALINLSGYIGKTVSRLVKEDLNILGPLTSKDNFKLMQFPHYPDEVFANLMMMDSNYVDNPLNLNLDGKYFIICMDKDADFNISGKNISIVKEDNNIDIKSNVTYKLKEDKYYFYLPYHNEYEFNISDINKLKIELYDINNFGILDYEYSSLKNDNMFNIDLSNG